MFVRLILSAVAALVLMASPASAQVPGPYAAQLAQQLARGETALRDQGFTRVAGPFAGGLASRGERRVPITLRAGQEYRIFGVCDADCTDLDLRLLEGGATPISEDLAANDVPIVAIRPRVTGQYVIQVLMPGCANAPCYFAVNVYAR